MFDCGSGVMTFNFGSFTQTGGTFNCQNATVDSTTAAGLRLFLNGGVFNAPTGTMTFNGGIFERGAGGTFNHNNGTVIFAGNTVEVRVINSVTSTQEFGSLTVSTPGGLFGSDNDLIRVNGNLSLAGQAFSVNFEARGNVTVQNGFSTNTSTHLIFAGGSDQTYINNGGTNPTGTFAINKPTGTVTAATSLILGSVQPLTITSGALYLNANSNLTIGGLTIGANGRLVNESATTITLGGSVLNNGAIDLQGSGAGCPDADTILIRSSVDGTSRFWSGFGRYRLVDVDVKDMAGTTGGGNTVKQVFSGNNSGNVNSSWSFNLGCPSALSISPSNVGVQTGATQAFTSGGGFAPYSFSIPVNNSGATINSATGLYTAGTTPGVADTVRVTDGFGATADAMVNTFGAANRLAFTVQPTNTVAGQAVSPAIKVSVQDAFGNTVTNSSAAITLSIQNNPGGGTPTGTLTRNAVAGIGTFDNLSINRAANGYTLRATSGSLASSNSDAFNVGPGPAAQLAFVVQPSTATPNSIIAPPVQVAIQDASGNTVLSASDIVTIAIGNNPGGGTLSGMLARSSVNGVATFDDLSIDAAGQGYTLLTSSGPLAVATSAPFNITNPFGVTNTNDSGEGSLRQAIINANATPGAQTISFNIPGTAPYTITPVGSLPPVTDPLIVDATTQTGYVGTPIIEIRGAGLSQSLGFDLRATSTIKGLAINRFGRGVILQFGASGTLIEDNYIGTDITGTSPMPNVVGIHFTGAGGVVINQNLISGNLFEGVYVDTTTPASSNLTNVVKRNLIGTDATGENPLPNNTGIRFTTPNLAPAGSPAIIGGSAADANTIAFNVHTGVLIRNYVNISVRGNRIHSNGFLGIDLKRFGNEDTAEVTPNDPNDADFGSNNLQNFPILTSAVVSGGSTTIAGILNSTPSESFTLDFYSSGACDASIYGEGENYLGSSQVTTDASGIVGFSANLPVSVGSGQIVTATATDSSGNTSEFSRCIAGSVATYTISGRLTDIAANPIAFARLALDLDGHSHRVTSTDSNGNYSFTNVGGGRNYTLTPTVPHIPNLDFTPINRTYTNLSSDQMGQDFTAAPSNARFTLGGTIKSIVGGAPFRLGGVTVSVTGAVVSSAQTDTNGFYFFNNLPAGDYTITPSRPGFTFTPSSTTLTITPGNNAAANFNAALNPPVEGRVVFVNNGSLTVMNADGSAVLNLRTTISEKPSMSRDGSLIAYVQRTCVGPCTNPPNRIFKMNFDGSGAVPLLSAPNSSILFAEPVWSPDNSTIAFIRKHPNGLERSSIRLLNVATGVETTTVFTAASRTEIESLSWSPDGQKIAFVQRSDANRRQVFTIKSDGTVLQPLTSAGGNNYGAAWSPDGTKIAFLRLEPLTGRNGAIFTINPDGTGETEISSQSHSSIAWSPDSQRLSFNRTAGTLRYGVVNRDGTGVIVFSAARQKLSWSNTFAPMTAAGSPVSTTAGGVSLTFNNVASAGQTSVVPIAPASAGSLPGGYVVGGQAYEIITTASVSPPISVCFNVAANTAVPTQARFNLLSIMHNEGGILVDRTVSRDFPTRTICASVTSLSPFALAEQIDTGLPRISGIAIDADGSPLNDVTITLTGAESRTTQTGSDGAFSFVNLTEGGNYNVSPKQIGYLFTEYNQDFVNLTGEQTVVFEGAAASFQISGQVVDGNGVGVSGIAIDLDGTVELATTTDANGTYAFAGLPAEGFYSVTPLDFGRTMSPNQIMIDPLTSDATGVDFTTFAPTAAQVTVSGRAIDASGQGIGKIVITIQGADGTVRSTLTNPFGYYSIDGIEVGRTYLMSADKKGFVFAGNPRSIRVVDELSNVGFVGEAQ